MKKSTRSFLVSWGCAALAVHFTESLWPQHPAGVALGLFSCFVLWLRFSDGY